MKLYVSGPMTGIAQLNFPTFNRHAMHLRAAAYEVINPAELGTQDDLSWSDYLRRDIAALMQCDGIAMLPGWESSKGACLERHIALELGMVVGDVTSFLLMSPRTQISQLPQAKDPEARIHTPGPITAKR